MDLTIQQDFRMELAQAYVPFQTLERLYPPEKALVAGTVFPELHMPYHPRGRYHYQAQDWNKAE